MKKQRLPTAKHIALLLDPSFNKEDTYKIFKRYHWFLEPYFIEWAWKHPTPIILLKHEYFMMGYDAAYGFLLDRITEHRIKYWENLK